jgi:hypothetical protein
MAPRFHVVLTPAQYAFLSDEARRSIVSMGELIRRAIDTTYGPAGAKRVHFVTHTLGRRSGVRLTD